MMKFVVVLFLFSVSLSISSLSQDTLPGYKRYPTIPPIALTGTDGSAITKSSLRKNRAMLLMYFSPDCDHCKKQVEEMIKRMDELKDVQIVMATYQPMDHLAFFEKKYQLSKYKNILSGRDTKYILPPFFKMRNMPYLALYDRKGNLITTFDGNVGVDKILAQFN